MRPVVEKYMRTFYRLEKAGVPREFTGKLASRLISYGNDVTTGTANKLSDLMRPMTNDQRRVFLRFLQTDNTGASLDELASRAKKLYRR